MTKFQQDEKRVGGTGFWIHIRTLEKINDVVCWEELLLSIVGSSIKGVSFIVPNSK